MELFKANNQWSTRPADERFSSLEDLHTQTKAYAEQAREKLVSVADIRTEAVGGDVELVGKAKIPAKLSHWAFGQIASKVGAPASYLRELPATLASQNLNYGLKQLEAVQGEGERLKLMFHQNGSLLLRAFTSDQYARIWNYEVAERLLGLQEHGWEPAKPDTHWSGEVGTCIMCGGTGKQLSEEPCMYCAGTGKELPALYASDHDMFAFVKNSHITIGGSDRPLQKGLIVENSEVGARALKFTKFYYDKMCGNHIIWGASDVVEIDIRHIGAARDKFQLYSADIRKYANESASDDEAVITRAKSTVIAATREEVLDKLFGLRQLKLSKKTIEAGLDAINLEQDGDPNTVWGAVCGLTRYSQTLPYADQRTEVDKAAGKLLEVSF